MGSASVALGNYYSKYAPDLMGYRTITGSDNRRMGFALDVTTGFEAYDTPLGWAHI